MEREQLDSRGQLDGLGPLDDGLDELGRIRREGDLGRVDPVFAPLITATESGLRGLLGRRLHSLYLYGSVPRGTAVVGRSDLDVTVILHDEPTGAERAAVGRLADALHHDTDLVSEVGILVEGRHRVLSVGERYDFAFQIAGLCTPWWGPDLALELPDQYPSVELARHVNGGVRAVFGRLDAALTDPGTPDLDVVRQRVGRRIVRLAFACVLFRWPGWSSDPTTIRQVVTAYYPDRAEELTSSIRLGWGRLEGRPPVTADDHAQAVALLARAAPWWTTEHHRVTG